MINQADLILKNGIIYTMNKKDLFVEALSIANGIIIGLGSNSTIEKNFKAKQDIDLKGKFVCPGFNDAHTHLLNYAAKFDEVNLEKVKSPKEALEKIKNKVQSSPKGKWIFGFGWDESNWDEKRYLNFYELNNIAPNNPCFIRRECGHLVAVNNLALKELNIQLNDPDLPIDPHSKKPTGIITDILINRIADSPKLKRTQEDLEKAVKTACEYANSLGLTSVTDNVNSLSVKAYLSAWKKKELTIRVYLNVYSDEIDPFLNIGLKTYFGDTYLRFGGIKIFTDGSFGAHTAALKEPYHDDPKTKGEIYITENEYSELLKKAIKFGWQTATHAIGDEAIEFVLKTFEKITNNKAIQEGRHRIEHAEYLTNDLLKRVEKLGLVLSMQPNFAGRWGKKGQLYETRIGSERYKYLNNFKQIASSHAKLCFGSDGMPLSPLFGIWSVVTHPINEIKLSLEQALYYYTLGSAYSNFEEDVKGSIEQGKYADLVVLEENLFKINPEKIKDIKISMTIINGKIVYPNDS